MLAQDLLGRLPRAQVVENTLDRDAEAPDNGLAVADVGVDGDSVDLTVHGPCIAQLYRNAVLLAYRSGQQAHRTGPQVRFPTPKSVPARSQSAIPWFGPCGASLRPGHTSCPPPPAAAPGEGRGKGGRHFGARPLGLSLTAASTAARWHGTGRSILLVENPDPNSSQLPTADTNCPLKVIESAHRAPP